MTEQMTTAEQWVPEVPVRVDRGGHLVEHRWCESLESVAEIIESREARGAPTAELIVVEPHPPEVIVAVLRAIADAFEEGRPVAMPRPFPHIRLQLLTEGTEAPRPAHSELHLRWQDLAQPGDERAWARPTATSCSGRRILVRTPGEVRELLGVQRLADRDLGLLCHGTVGEMLTARS